MCLVAVSGGYSSLQYAGFSLRWLLLLQSTGSGRAGFSGCGAWAWLLRGMWDLPRPGLKPVSPALGGRFPTTAPPGKPPQPIFKLSYYFYYGVVGILYTFGSIIPYEVYSLQIFSPIPQIAFSLCCFLWCAETFQFDVVPLVYFCFCYLCFWCHIHEIIVKTNVMKFFPYVLFQEFYSFRSYI